VDRAGLVGQDGATHAGAFDLSYARALPGLAILAPADEAECRLMLQTAYLHTGPALVRYPRGAGPGIPVDPGLNTLPWGKGEIRRTGHGVALLAFGSLVAPCATAAAALDATLANMRFVKPLDLGLVLDLARGHDLLVTVEENAIAGGAGSAVAEALSAAGLGTRCIHLGLPDRYIDHAAHEAQLAACGLDAAGIEAAVRAALADPAA
jgi:1-deoxy-D-xylulose-5-phosphate synthase